MKVKLGLFIQWFGSHVFHGSYEGRTWCGRDVSGSVLSVGSSSAKAAESFGARMCSRCAKARG